MLANMFITDNFHSVIKWSDKCITHGKYKAIKTNRNNEQIQQLKLVKLKNCPNLSVAK